jgi:hypothetical protein
MMHADDITMAANGYPLPRSSKRPQGASDGRLALRFEFDGRDIDLLHEIIEALDWRSVTFGCTIVATIECQDIGDLVTLRLADSGTRRLEWHPADLLACCHQCLDPSGVTAFVDDFTPDAIVNLAGDARIEFADADVLGQFALACDARRDRFQVPCWSNLSVPYACSVTSQELPPPFFCAALTEGWSASRRLLLRGRLEFQRRPPVGCTRPWRRWASSREPICFRFEASW